MVIEKINEKAYIKHLMQDLVYNKCSVSTAINIQWECLLSDIVPLIKKSTEKNSSTVPTLSKRTATSISPAQTVSYLSFLLYANLVIIPSYQIMSITAAEIRKKTYISTLQQ